MQTNTTDAITNVDIAFSGSTVPSSSITDTSAIDTTGDSTSSPKTSSLPKYKPGVVPSPPDPCASTPCMNNASCISKKDGFVCECPERVVGYQCEQAVSSECIGSDIDPCERGSRCFLTLQQDVFCECPPGLEGSHCQVDVNECASSPCQRGTCHDVVGYFKCACEDGFTGVQCEFELDECSSSPCRANGTCRDMVSDYLCDCVNGFNGKSCEVNIDDCAGVPCQNGAYCEDGLGNYTCQCTSFYHGVYCEEKAALLVSAKAASTGFAVVAIVAIVALFGIIMTLDAAKLLCKTSTSPHASAKQ